MSARRILYAVVATLSMPYAADCAVGQSSPPAFEPGTLIIGYKSEADRGQAEQELKAAKDAVRVRGDRAENVQFEVAMGALFLSVRETPCVEGFKVRFRAHSLKQISTKPREREGRSYD